MFLFLSEIKKVTRADTGAPGQELDVWTRFTKKNMDIS